MAAAIVYEGVKRSQGGENTLFQGQKFWLSHQVPQRKWLIENAEANGASIVPLEKQADILIVDHARKNAAPGTHSYSYIERSIRNAKLEDLADHVVGVKDRASRPVGSVTTAAKGGRTQFTEADDQYLWDWIKPYEEVGAKTAGNVIFQLLEENNPRHTYQSWRDRWLKYVQYQNRQTTDRFRARDVGTAEPREPLTRAAPTVDEPALAVRSSPTRKREAKTAEVASPRAIGSGVVPKAERGLSPVRKTNNDFTLQEAKLLMKAARHILDTKEEDLSKSWQSVAKEYPAHSAHEWRLFFDTTIAPVAKTRLMLKLYLEIAELDRNVAKVDYDRSKLDESDPGLDEKRAGLEEKKTELKEKRETLVEERARLEEQKIRPNKGESANTDHPERQIVGDEEVLKKIAEESIATPETCRERSPSSQPESLTLSRPPEQNESRKRSPGKSSKSNSQESADSSTLQNLDSTSDVDEYAPRSSQSKRKWDAENVDKSASPTLPRLKFTNTPRQKRTKKLRDEPGVMKFEIPSTPEHGYALGLAEQVVEGEVELELPLSPTPKARRSTRKYVGSRELDRSRTESPLFMPQDSSRRAETDSSGNDDDDDVNDERTSPLSVKLVSDQDVPASSSFSQQAAENDDNLSDLEDEEQTPEFETAPEMSQIWETAPETMTATMSDREGIPGAIGRRIDTQALFEHFSVGDGGEDDFALPEPEGGWGDVEGGETAEDQYALPDLKDGWEDGNLDIELRHKGEQDVVPSKVPDTKTGETTLQKGTNQNPITSHALSSEGGRKFPNPLDQVLLPTAAAVDDFVDNQLLAHPDMDEEFLLLAIEATCMDEALVPTVYESLARGEGVPEGVKGVWTDQDDRALERSDKGEIERVERLHGAKAVARRWLWLEGGRV